MVYTLKLFHLVYVFSRLILSSTMYKNLSVATSKRSKVVNLCSEFLRTGATVVVRVAGEPGGNTGVRFFPPPFPILDMVVLIILAVV